MFNLQYLLKNLFSQLAYENAGLNVLKIKLPVDRQVQTHELAELRIFVSKHTGKIPRPIFRDIDGAHARSLAIQVAVNDGRDCRQLRQQVH